jgi:hypothetical protein
MTDIFFSYSSKDRERVRPVRDALVAQGFDVFWDQTVPAGTDWDRWIRQHLNDAKCAIVFWSAHSVASDNVRHEAAVAKQQGKFLPVLLDALTADQFPMGLYATQAVHLATWTGSTVDGEWEKLKGEVEARLTPLWVRRMIDGLEAELVSERARRESAERRDKTLREQIVKEAHARQDLARELEHAREEIEMLKARMQGAVARQPVIEQRPAQHPQPALDQATSPPGLASGLDHRMPEPAAGARASHSPEQEREPEPVERIAWEPRVKIMLGIAGGLLILTLGLLPVGLSGAGALVLVVPAGVLVAIALVIKNKNEGRLDAADN